MIDACKTVGHRVRQRDRLAVRIAWHLGCICVAVQNFSLQEVIERIL